MKKLPFFIFSMFVVMTSCEKDSNLVSGFDSRSETSQQVSDILFQNAVIGEPLPNPLSFQNVIKAFENLPPETKGGITVADLHPTHKYIAFTPSNENELEAVLSMDQSEVLISSYPLDYEVSDGLIVPDERFMKNGFSYRWAYVPIEYDLTKIQCPFIYYYDIFSLDSALPTKTNAIIPSDLLDALECESYALCGQDILEIKQTKASNFSPYGRFRFYDADSKTYRGVDGLSVRTVRGTHSSYTHCDENGNFNSPDSFKYGFSYEIHFSRTDFMIRKNDETNEIVIKYSKCRGPIFKDFNDPETSFYATVSRAAIVYYYGDNLGLRRPPMDSDQSVARLAIQAELKSDPGIYGCFFLKNRGILNDRPKLEIYREASSGVRPNVDVYATTMHELAHASHWRYNQAIFNQTDKVVKESYARGVQWVLTKNVYPNYKVPFYYRQSYSGIVQDLIDGYGLKESSYYATWVNGDFETNHFYKKYYDSVTGFTACQIEDAVRKSKTWNEFEYNLVAVNPDVADKQDVSKSFLYWNSSN